ncbi:MAG: hypothetical protein AAGA29_12880 [Planctomycetota bacterium]
MPRRFVTLLTMLVLLLSGSPFAAAQGIDVTLVEVWGEAQPAERIRAGGADRIGGLSWVDRDGLIVFGHDGRGFFNDVEETDDGFDPATGEHRGRFVYRLDARTGERTWTQRFSGGDERVSVSPDGRHVLVQFDETNTQDDAGNAVLARVLDARTGEVDRDILHADVCRAVRRDEASRISSIAFGPRRGEAVVVFAETEEDLRRAQRAEGGAIGLFDSYGTRAYRYHWQRRRRVGRPFKTDPEPTAFDLSPDGELLGYVAQLLDVLCIYDAPAQRDRALAGRHQTGAEGMGELAIDAPFYSGIQISNTHAVVARDAPNGHGVAQVFVINLTNGQVEARIETPGGHVVFDVDFDRERIAVTGSACHLALYDFAGNELYLEEDATQHRNLAIALSPDGRRVALGGWANTVHVYDIAGR